MIRGVWLLSCHHCPDLIRAEDWARVLDRLVAVGCNTLFPAVWNRGYTAWPSAVMERHGLPRQEPIHAERGFDPLEALTRLGQERGLRVIPWFEYGFAAEPIGMVNAILATHPHWAALDRQGRVVEDGGLRWLNGLHPEVQTFLQDLLLEVAARYPVDGLQVDDHLALPRSGSHDATTQALHRRIRGRTLPASDGDGDWIRFRCDAISTWVEQTGQRLHAQREGLLWSVAPTPLPVGRSRLMQDSARWLRDGSVDLLVPQFYRNGIGAFRQVLLENRRAWPRGSRANVAAGIALVANGRPLDARTVHRMVELSHQQGLAGVVLFHHGTLLDGEPAVARVLQAFSARA